MKWYCLIFLVWCIVWAGWDLYYALNDSSTSSAVFYGACAALQCGAAGYFAGTLMKS